MNFICKVRCCLLLVPLLLVRCVKEITLDLPNESPRLVVNASFEPGHPFKVRLSASQSVVGVNRPLSVPDSRVYLEQEGVRIDTLLPVSYNGVTIWESQRTVLPNVLYALRVSASGLEPVFTVASAPHPFPVQQAVIQQDDMRVVTLSDGRERLYMPLHIRLPDALPLQPFFGFSVETLCDVYDNAGGVHPVLTGTESRRTPFSADARTSALLYALPEPWSMLHQNYWQLPTRQVDLHVWVDYEPQTEVPRTLMLQWFTFSEAYYRYYLSLTRQGANTPLSDPDALYNNIEGGYGNFSGFARDTLLIPIPK